MRTIKKVERLKRPPAQAGGRAQAGRHLPRKLRIQTILVRGSRAAGMAAREYRQISEANDPAQYANDKSVQMAGAAASKAVPTAAKGAKALTKGTIKAGRAVVRRIRQRTVKQRIKTVKGKPTEATKPARASHSSAYRAGRNRAMQAAQRRTQAQLPPRQATNARYAARGNIRAAAKASRSAVKSTQRTIKASARSLKTAKVAATTATRTAVKAAPKAVQLARAAGKAALATIKLAAKAIVAATKALVAAAQAVIAFIAAGGGLVALVVIVIALIAALFGSAFGILFSDEAESGALTQAVVDIQIDYTERLQAEIDRLSAGGAYDAVSVHYDGDFDGDTYMPNNWTDVLAVYAVKMQFEGSEVLSMSPEKQRILQAVFNDMNPVSYRTEVENIPAEDEDGEDTTTLHIHVNITSMDYLEGGALYQFTPEQIDLLEELLSPDFYELFADILAVDMYGGISKAELLQIVNDLPAGTKGAAIVQGAASRVGTPYSKLDCSKLVQTVYAEVGVSLPRTSVEQAKYCYNNGYSISASQVQPGDLIFWSKPGCSCGRWNEVHHVGIYIGNGQIIDASSAKGRVVLRNVWQGSGYEIMLYARPHM